LIKHKANKWPGTDWRWPNADVLHERGLVQALGAMINKETF